MARRKFSFMHETETHSQDETMMGWGRAVRWKDERRVFSSWHRICPAAVVRERSAWVELIATMILLFPACRRNPRIAWSRASSKSGDSARTEDVFEPCDRDAPQKAGAVRNSGS